MAKTDILLGNHSVCHTICSLPYWWATVTVICRADDVEFIDVDT
jgi:hypothetical protein